MPSLQQGEDVDDLKKGQDENAKSTINVGSATDVKYTCIVTDPNGHTAQSDIDFYVFGLSDSYVSMRHYKNNGNLVKIHCDLLGETFYHTSFRNG